MKHIILFIFTISFITSCGTKKALVTTTPTETVVVEQDSVKTETSTPEIVVSETKDPEVKDETNETVTEVIIPTEINTENNDVLSHSSFNDLLQKHVSNQGNVNYKGFKTDISKLRGYITELGKTQPTSLWTKEDKLAFWINAYNALTIDLILRNYPVKSIKDIKKPWNQRLWQFGDKWINLNDIEHQILRKMNEPRIHFGIVCASFSCPQLQNQAFTDLNTEILLTKATKGFLKDNKRNELSENRVKISKIFKWFAKDFKTTHGSVLQFINSYSEINISNKAKVSYKDYNWDLND